MYRLPCTIEYIHDETSPAYILTLSRTDLPQFISFVEKIKEGSCKGVELAGKDKKVCRVGREGGLLVFVIGDLTLRLDEDQDGCFVAGLYRGLSFHQQSHQRLSNLRKRTEQRSSADPLQNP